MTKSPRWLVPAMLALAATGADAGELRATIRNVKPQQGKLWVALYESADAFASGRRFAGVIVEADGTEVPVAFAGLAPGRYGVAVFQDRDGDSALGKTLFGVPTEPIGFSREAKAGAFGPPAFDAIAVPVAEGKPTETVVRMSE